MVWTNSNIWDNIVRNIYTRFFGCEKKIIIIKPGRSQAFLFSENHSFQSLEFEN